MIYPSNTAAPSIVTEFVNGIKFDVCEVDSAAYDMLFNKASRFFLCCEDNIVGIEFAEEYAAKTGEVRWDLFCGTKSDMLNKIKSAQADLEAFEKWNSKPGFLAKQTAEKIKNRLQAIYKVNII